MSIRSASDLRLDTVQPDRGDEMGTHDDRDRATGNEDVEVERVAFHSLGGTEGLRAQKLRKLETLIAYLERLRRTLAADTVAERTGYEGPSRYIDAPVWPWLAAGIVLGALFVLLARSRMELRVTPLTLRLLYEVLRVFLRPFAVG